MDTFSHVPPGFRFHPTDEELVDYYLRKKVASNKIDLDVIKDVDLYKIEPWDLQEKCKIGMEEQNEWYFFSHKDKKYPTGTRTNRATTAGFWKATGRDKPIYTKSCLVGMRKTLVFYRGRAPNGHKSDWIMHEYRLETTENGTAPEEGWVVCRVFKKRVATVRRMEGAPWFDDHVAGGGGFMPDLVGSSPRQQLLMHHHHHPNTAAAVYRGQQLYHCKPELEYQHLMPSSSSQDAFLQQQLPELVESPKMAPPPAYIQGSCSLQQSPDEASGSGSGSGYAEQQQPPPMMDYMYDDSVTDWRVLDKFVASQLYFSHGGDGTGATKEAGGGYSNLAPVVFHHQAAENKQQPAEAALDYASTSAATSGGDGEASMWK